jgi:hypothetical protein
MRNTDSKSRQVARAALAWRYSGSWALVAELEAGVDQGRSATNKIIYSVVEVGNIDLTTAVDIGQKFRREWGWATTVHILNHVDQIADIETIVVVIDITAGDREDGPERIDSPIAVLEVRRGNRIPAHVFDSRPAKDVVDLASG